MPDVRSWLHKKTAEDERAIAIFEAHKHEFALDEGGQLSRYEEARKFTEQYFKGTPYAVKVEEYCCMCTVTSLYRLAK